MRSIRVKLTLALLAMSFVAIAVVGLTARWISLRRVDALVVERALQGFVQRAENYYARYGTWESPRAAEWFLRPLSRPVNGAPIQPGGPRLGGSSTPRPGVVPEMDPRRRPGGRPGQNGLRPPGVRAAAPVPVVITNSAGSVLVPLAGLKLGDRVSADDLARARPIVSDGKKVGLAVPLARPPRTDLEEEYLSAIRDSWVFALVLAAVLAVPLGLVMGNRFTRPIRELTDAIRGMGKGNLRQSVRVRGDDEMAKLSEAFNQMSDELATAYGELEASREQLSEQAELLQELSRRDELTGLLNRRAFRERVSPMFAQALRFDRPLTLAMADIDHFKLVNDDFSHGVGDSVLREIAQLIHTHVREIDVVARYGGEEFAIAFPETSLGAAARLLDRLRTLIAEHDWERLATGLEITLSAGLADRASGRTLREVLDEADARLREAKSSGRNLVRF